MGPGQGASPSHILSSRREEPASCTPRRVAQPWLLKPRKAFRPNEGRLRMVCTEAGALPWLRLRRGHRLMLSGGRATRAGAGAARLACGRPPWLTLACRACLRQCSCSWLRGNNSWCRGLPEGELRCVTEAPNQSGGKRATKLASCGCARFKWRGLVHPANSDWDLFSIATARSAQTGSL
jgi:hypothetical protein